MLEELEQKRFTKRRTRRRTESQSHADRDGETSQLKAQFDANPALRTCAGWLLALLTIAAPLLGGATALWAQAVLAIATGCVFLIVPPSRSLGAPINIGVASLVLLAGTAFLPASWWLGSDWRDALNAVPGLILPGTRSPQPWLTFEAFGLMLLGLGWAYYLLGYVWDRKVAPQGLRVFSFGIILLAAAALFGFLTGHKVPFWPVTENSGVNFGFFPNRNQTANVLALGGVMINALAFEGLRGKRKASAVWFLCLGLIGTALIVAYSRSGIILFFGGIAVWSLLSTRLSTSTQNAAIAVSGAILLLTSLFLFGGEAFRRFQAETVVALKNFRLLLQWDAWDLAAGAPWFGHGLGNFEPLFAMAREQSRMENRAVHPESDWMWAAVELGWLAPVILLGLFVVWMRRCLPFENGTAPLLRSAAFLGGIGFACHGLVDVSGHRLGSLWPALFLMSLAVHPGWVRAPERWVKPAFRGTGALLVALGGWWLASHWMPLPTSAYAQRLEAQIESAVDEDRAEEVIAGTTEALRIAPLDPNLYYQRARALAVTHSTALADRDFAVSRALEPNWAELCFYEGMLWLELDEPDRALDAWDEALKRPLENDADLFRRMLAAADGRHEVRDVLRVWAREKRSFLLLYIASSGKLEFELESEQLLSEDPGLESLTPAQRNQFFRSWAERRELSRLGPLLLGKPEWHSESWPLIARFHAEQGNYQEAYETVARFASMPVRPAIESGEALPHLEREFYVKSKDLVNGLTLFGAQVRSGKLDDAAATLQVLKEVKGRPRYLFALDSEVQAQRHEWEKAWLAWVDYENIRD